MKDDEEQINILLSHNVHAFLTGKALIAESSHTRPGGVHEDGNVRNFYRIDFLHLPCVPFVAPPAAAFLSIEATYL